MPKQTFLKKLYSGSGWALFTMFVWELVEEGLENLIAMVLSSGIALFVTKALSTLAIITATQGIKVALKRFLMPLIKNLSYKEGNDKMEKLKTFFLGIWANKKTILGTVSSAVMVASGSGVIDVSALPQFIIEGYNLTPIIYYVALGIIALLGVFGKGAESVKAFFERVGLIKVQKEVNLIEKEAQKELIAEQKKANQTQAEQDKIKAKEEADAKLKAEKEKADAEYRAKVEQAKAKFIEQSKLKAE
ncbi:hypothetical protein EOL99_03450 [Candidatus Falkowbacteria bacterium]|nr:hypothetical protein [Candidatus Falkowbacteria bacterium]